MASGAKWPAAIARSSIRAVSIYPNVRNARPPSPCHPHIAERCHAGNRDFTVLNRRFQPHGGANPLAQPIGLSKQIPAVRSLKGCDRLPLGPKIPFGPASGWRPCRSQSRSDAMPGPPFNLLARRFQPTMAIRSPPWQTVLPEGCGGCAGLPIPRPNPSGWVTIPASPRPERIRFVYPIPRHPFIGRAGAPFSP